MRAAIFMVPALLITAPVLGAHGQDIASLQQGARIRVKPLNGKATIGTFAAADSDSLRLVYRPAGSLPQPTALGLADVKTIEVSRGRSRARGALVKGLTGFFGGAIIGAVFGSVIDGSTCKRSCRDENIVLSVIGLGGIGFISGSIYGAVMPPDQWEPVRLHSR